MSMEIPVANMPVPQEKKETEQEKSRREYMEYMAPLDVVGERYGLLRETEYEPGVRVKHADISLENSVLYGNLKRRPLDQVSRDSIEKNLNDVRGLWESKKQEIASLEAELEKLNEEAVALQQKLEERWSNPLFRAFDPEWTQLQASYKEKAEKLKQAQTGEGFSERHWRERIAVLEAILQK